MFTRSLTLLMRTFLGILMILNGPTNALAVVALSSQACSGSAQDAAIQTGEQTAPKKCCGRCAKKAEAERERQKPSPNTDSNKIRPTCPVCPKCPDCPNNCCVSCPLKA